MLSRQKPVSSNTQCLKGNQRPEILISTLFVFGCVLSIFTLPFSFAIRVDDYSYENWVKGCYKKQD